MSEELLFGVGIYRQETPPASKCGAVAVGIYRQETTTPLFLECGDSSPLLVPARNLRPLLVSLRLTRRVRGSPGRRANLGAGTHFHRAPPIEHYLNLDMLI